MKAFKLSSLPLALLAAAAALSACKAKGTYVHVQIAPAASEPAGIRTIDLQLALGGKTTTTTLSDPGGGDLALPTDVTLKIGSGSGQLAILAIARSATGTEIDRAAATVPVITGTIADTTVQLAGGTPDLQTSDASHDFGAVGAGSTSQFVVTVRNAGFKASGTITTGLSGAGATGWSIAADNCSGNALAPVSTCAVTLQFKPVSTGPFAAVFTASALPGGAAVTALTGTGTVNPQNLAVSVSGNGQGAVSSAPGGLSCTSGSGICTHPFDYGTQVTLTANAGTGSTFTGWSGPAGCTGSSTCTVLMTAAQSVTATFTLQTFTVTVGGGGNGSGAVTSDVGGLKCTITGGVVSGTCTATVNYGSGMTLTASAGTDSNFTSWTSCTSSSGNTCTITNITSAQSATATFTRIVLLTVVPGGATGTISSGDGKINCGNGGTICSAPYVPGTVVTLTATAAGTVTAGSTSTFAGWSVGGCPGTTCSVTMTQPLTITGTFNWNLTASKSGNGIGTVQCSVVGSGTVGTCATNYPAGTQVIIQAMPGGEGNLFNGFSGVSGCPGVFDQCTVTMSAPVSIDANFVTTIYNVVFVSSATYLGNLGSARSYDANCNALATSAGINNSTSNAFIAWMTDANSSGTASFLNLWTTTTTTATSGAPAEGFIRMDGADISNTLSDIYQGGRIMNPINLDELGAPHASEFVYTGTSATGDTATNLNCSNWTGAGTVLMGLTSAGPGWWTAGPQLGCTTIQRPIYCFEKDRTAALTVFTPPAGSKRIFLLSGFAPGGGVTAADNTCTTVSYTTTGIFKALISTETASAASRALIANTNYYSDDSMAPQFIGTGTQIAKGLLNTGIWARSTGGYGLSYVQVWTGSSAPDGAGSGTTCMSWGATSGLVGIYGIAQVLAYPNSTTSNWWSWNSAGCGSSQGLYCVEQ